jgi:protein-S-isoprenylcysteine O-methyltransferase Ste14
MGVSAVTFGLAAMWFVLVAGWTITSARRRETHEVCESLGFGLWLSLAVLALSTPWQPTSLLWLRAAGVTMQLCGAMFVVLAFHNLRTRGKPTDAWEHTTAVVESSVYARIRHPMYAGTGIWAAGIAMARPSAGSVLLAAACVVLTLCAALAEDSYNLKKFGEPYAEYMRRVPLAGMLRGRPPSTGTKG